MPLGSFDVTDVVELPTLDPDTTNTSPSDKVLIVNADDTILVFLNGEFNGICKSNHTLSTPLTVDFPNPTTLPLSPSYVSIIEDSVLYTGGEIRTFGILEVE